MVHRGGEDGTPAARDPPVAPRCGDGHGLRLSVSSPLPGWGTPRSPSMVVWTRYNGPARRHPAGEVTDEATLEHYQKNAAVIAPSYDAAPAGVSALFPSNTRSLFGRASGTACSAPRALRLSGCRIRPPYSVGRRAEHFDVALERRCQATPRLMRHFAADRQARACNGREPPAIATKSSSRLPFRIELTRGRRRSPARVTVATPRRSRYTRRILAHRTLGGLP